jgi:hypothetical protein
MEFQSKSWYEDNDDVELIMYMIFLVSLDNVDDVRYMIMNYILSIGR